MSEAATILDFRSRRASSAVDIRHVEQLECAEQMARYAADLIEIETDCARRGARLMPTGGIMSNRALYAALTIVVALINLSGRQCRFKALAAACDLALDEIERERSA